MDIDITVLKFDDQAERESFVKELQDFLGTAEVGTGSKGLEIRQDQMLKQAVTKAHHQMVLERFFRVAFAQECLPGYRRIDRKIFEGECVPCECNGHAVECDDFTGACIFQPNMYT
ncbi:uncharacterized protein [Ptychodera flava]|uniref:uncharacterized protein n=1 Tax=Ptychodera flava TaxID=63121 RepID=UPI00396A677B